ncbi:eCIS core domain-containing protein [Nostoc sp.]|uniref:eCIS core domain-containing protein n=1 Tax=Nostoc sp. TaxID=1180 RepID=UPI002FFB9EAE
MRERIGQPKKATTASFSIPTLKQPIRGFGLESFGASSQAASEVRFNKPLGHDISRISLRPQTKLTVNQPGDVYEQEADRVAGQVMQTMNEPVNKQSVQREELPEEEELQMKSLPDSNISLQREELPEEEELQMKPLTASPQAVTGVQPSNKPLTHDISRMSLRLQTRLTVNQPGDVYEQEADRAAQQVMQRMSEPGNRQSIQREALPEEEELQMKSLANSITPVVQRKGGGVAATSDLETSIQQARGGGQPLSDDIRQPMEQAFGTDFSGVKIHTDNRSDQLNQSVEARAFTTGQDIFFRQGEYSPGSHGGKELLAHELTHVVQQNGSALGRKSLPDEGIKKNKIQAEALLNSPSEYPSVIQRNPFKKVKKFFSKDGGNIDNGGNEIQEIQVNGEDWKKYMELDILTMQPSDIITDRQFGHNLYINIRWYNKSQKRLRLMTPPPLEYFEEITKITTDSGGNRTTETESVDQYAKSPNSNTFRSYVRGTKDMIVDPGKSLTAIFLDPPQITITQGYKSRTVKFKIGLQGSQQWLMGVQRLTCDNNKIIEHEFIPTILRAG